MNIKKLIINRIDQLNLSNNNISNLKKILSLPKYNISLYTNDKSNIINIINQLTMDNICKLCIDGYINFIIYNNKIYYINVEINVILLCMMRHTDIIYCNFNINDN